MKPNIKNTEPLFIKLKIIQSNLIKVRSMQKITSLSKLPNLYDDDDDEDDQWNSNPLITYEIRYNIFLY